ncbi:zinc transporter ZntB [Sulfitobacter sabulilitoris]|uniref:Zinc transporter ZntB n=1 Tax=Sulfitobacter sabulilitoris TaxID=2562655 RepID=A0A5S3PFG9_9RHOB|nr:zinc transporter ZntB [Sulfitobacter sabulilitoris]TMM52795.1 zinc transporter ZntB [Sulfitobacter sabulilitoris]
MPICVFDIYPDGSTTVPEDTALTGPGVYRWWHYDLSEPSLRDWAYASLPDIPAGALMQPETRPRCDRFDDGLILNLRGINLNVGQPADQMVSVRMWVSQGVVITVRMRRVFAIDDIRRAAEKNKAPPTVAAFLDTLIIRLTDRVQEKVLEIARITEDFELDLEDASTPPPADLPETRRSVIRLLRYLEPQSDALIRLAAIDLPLIPEQDALRLRELANRTILVVEELDSLRHRMSAVQDAHETASNTRLARNGYVLSVVAAIFLPLGFLTGLFGVNIAGMPGTDWPLAFAVLCISMVVLAAVLLGVMRWLRWL